MGTPTGLEAFRALERGMQVQALVDAACIGTAVHKHYVAQYYAHEDFFVALCSTKCGIDFTLVFRDGHEYHDMLWAIRLNQLPKPVKGMSAKELEEAQRAEMMADMALRRTESMQEILSRLAERELPMRFTAAKEKGQGMAFIRSLTVQERIYLIGFEAASLKSGKFDHYQAHYYPVADFYVACCTTRDGADFHLVFRHGRPYADMLRAQTVGRMA